MFPLGAVLFPGGVLPLQIFEPRYVQLVEDLERYENRFGVVLIKRGVEVGGGDERHDVGTVAEVMRREDVGDGLYLLVTMGRERIMVTQWLDDDPYPRAVIDPIPAVNPSPGLADAVRSAANALKQLMGIAVEMGADGKGLELELPDDPVDASWALCTAAPLGQFDRQRLLELDDPTARLTTLTALLDAKADDLRRTLLH